MKDKAVILSEYSDSKFRSVLTSLFGKMPALLSDNLSSSSDSSYVSTVTDLSTAEPAPASEPALPPTSATPVTPIPVTTTNKHMRKKPHRKRKKGSTAVTSPADKVILPPPPPPVLETPLITSASYADMLRKPQPVILSQCSSEADLTSPVLEFLNESSISSPDNQLANVISINQTGDLQSVFESSMNERSAYQNQLQSPTTLRPYSVFNHQSDTISDSHQKLINYFSRGNCCSLLSKKRTSYSLAM